MMDSSSSPLQWSDEWVIHSDDTGLQLIAGADRQIAIGGVSPQSVASITGWSQGAVHASTDEEAMLIDQLLAMGVLLPEVGTPIAVVGSGPLADELNERLQATGRSSSEGQSDNTTDFEILIRSVEGWPKFSPNTSHLAVNNRLHHTVVLGPLVIPGVSACTACLDSRGNYRWPAKSEPVVPAATRFPAVAAELILIQVGLALEGRSPLVNATIAWDLETGTSKQETLLKLPGCPTCDSVRSSGKIRLP